MPKDHTLPNEQRFAYWLGVVIRETREAAGRSVTYVAGMVNASEITAKRFERAETWPTNHELLVSAYAETAGIDDPRDLYAAALNRWMRSGEKPTLLDVDGLAELRGLHPLTPATKPRSAQPPKPPGSPEAADGS